jgi:hypothetical protein
MTGNFIVRDPALPERRMKGGPTAEEEPAKLLIMAIMSVCHIALVVDTALDRRCFQARWLGSRRRSRPRAPRLERRRPAVVPIIFGRAALLEGLSLLLVPPQQMGAAHRGLGFERFFRAWMIAALVNGLLIAHDGFASWG